MKTQEVTLSGKSAGVDSAGDMAMQDNLANDIHGIDTQARKQRKNRV